jgi:hypothetical protein
MTDLPQPDELAEGDQIELGPDDYLQESAVDVSAVVAAGASAVSALAAVYNANEARKSRRDRDDRPAPPTLELPPGVERDHNAGPGER